MQALLDGPNKQIESEILNMAAQINSATYRFVKLLGEFDNNKGWQGDGIKSFTHWLNWKIGMGGLMAREKVRVARALTDLPKIDTAFSTGEISYSKVRAMTRVATPENEDLLMMIAKHGTAAHIEQVVQKYQLCKQLQQPQEDSYKNATSFTWHYDDNGMMILHAKLPAEEGSLVIKALEIIVEENKRNTEEDETELKGDAKNVSAGIFSKEEAREKYKVSKANALVELAEHYLEREKISPTGSLNEKYQVFLHIRADQPHGLIDNQRFLTPEVTDRISCDCHVTHVIENKDGTVMDVGRRTRLIPRALSHALRIRDQGCRFPGCTQRHHTDVHHIKHWAKGGETNMGNLVTLCRHHHSVLHSGEYQLDTNEHGEMVFNNSKNQIITQSIFPQFEHSEFDADPEINDQTGKALWAGERMDLQMVLGGLFDREVEQACDL